MSIRELICIGCPLGCQLLVECDSGTFRLSQNSDIKVTGNACKRGEIYAIKECTDPTRILTTSVKIEGGSAHCLPVKTASDIPKGKIFDCMEALKGVTVKAPVNIGDIIIRNIASTGVDIIATKKVSASEPI